MSSKWSGYFKVVTPQPETEHMSDNQDMTGGGLYGNYSWYSRFLQGSSTRLQRYKEYESMDQDVEVALALDTIAEHMTENNNKTDLPIDLDMQIEEGQDIKSSAVMTLRAALRHWSSIHEWDNRLFSIARQLAIYGDVFFEKCDDFQTWKYIHPSKVLAAIVDKNDVRKIVAWQVKCGVEKARPSGVGPYQPPVGATSDAVSSIIPASSIVRFSLNDDMSEMAPFGDSIMRPVLRSHRQKMMLEDAILIYRIQRAPERRVFYVDVGKMPPHRVKQHLEQMKNEIKQKKIPTVSGGNDSIDSVYNVQSMSEDFYMPVRTDGRGSKVETLPGGQNLGELNDLDYFQAKVWRGLRVPMNWMKSGSDALFQDDKVGTAYIEEIRFSKFVQRLQGYIETVLDKEFKTFLQKANIIVDETLYKLKLPKPTNFASYRQQQMDSELLNSITNASNIEYLSKRFVLKRFGQVTDDDLLSNERLKMEELGIDPDNPPEDYLSQLYVGGMGGGDTFGMESGALGGGLGGGLGGEPIATDQQSEVPSTVTPTKPK